MWYPGVQEFWDLPIQVSKAFILPPQWLIDGWNRWSTTLWARERCLLETFFQTCLFSFLTATWSSWGKQGFRCWCKIQVKSFPRQLFQNCKGYPGELLLLTTFAELPPHLEYVGIQLQFGGSRIHFCLYKVWTLSSKHNHIQRWVWFENSLYQGSPCQWRVAKSKQQRSARGEGAHFLKV